MAASKGNKKFRREGKVLKVQTRAYSLKRRGRAAAAVREEREEHASLYCQ